jgi:hypothetical protein
MNSNAQTTAIISAGMSVLLETLGVIETEIFITTIGKNSFDYTKWRENLWENLTLEELFAQTAEIDASYTVPEGVQVL